MNNLIYLSMGLLSFGFYNAFAVSYTEQNMTNDKSNISSELIDYNAVDLINDMSSDSYTELIDDGISILDWMPHNDYTSNNLEEIFSFGNFSIDVTFNEDGDWTANILQLNEENEPTGLSEIIKSYPYDIHELTQDKTVIVTAENINTFQGRDDITSIIIADGVTSIDWNAFSGCTALTSITIPDSVTEIGDFAFEGCTGLTSITIPSNVTEIGEGAFYGCTGLTSINLKNVKSINESAFEGCSGLTSIELNDVDSIGRFAFKGCNGLTSLDLQNITSIGESAFEECINLKSADLKNVTSIGRYAFYECRGLTSINMECVMSIGYSAFKLCTDLTNLNIKNVVSIYELAFGECEKLKSVDLKNVKYVDMNAFYGCTNVISVNLSNVKSIDASAFNGCFGITVDRGDRYTIYDYSSYVGDRQTSLNIEGLSVIGEETFKYCQSLSGVTIGNGVYAVSPEAFKGCENLKNVCISDSISFIAEDAFEGCGNAKFFVPNKVMKDYLCSTCGISDDRIEIDANLATDQSNAWRWPEDGAMTVPEGVTKVGVDEFETLISGSIKIDIGCFFGRDDIKSVTFPDSIQSIGAGFCCECDNLQEITIPSSVEWIGEDAFECDNLKTINIRCTNDTISFENIIRLLDGFDNAIPSYLRGDIKFRFIYNNDNEVKHIDDYLDKSVIVTAGNIDTFKGRDDITSITIADDVKSIDANSFAWCSSLTSIEIPNSVQSIDKLAFLECSELTSITIPDSIKSISRDAFDGCNNLKTINIRCISDVVLIEDMEKVLDLFEDCGLGPEKIQVNFVFAKGCEVKSVN